VGVEVGDIFAVAGAGGAWLNGLYGLE